MQSGGDFRHQKGGEIAPQAKKMTRSGGDEGYSDDRENVGDPMGKSSVQDALVCSSRCRRDLQYRQRCIARKNGYDDVSHCPAPEESANGSGDGGTVNTNGVTRGLTVYST